MNKVDDQTREFSADDDDTTCDGRKEVVLYQSHSLLNTPPRTHDQLPISPRTSGQRELTVNVAPNPKSSMEPTKRYMIPRARYTLLSVVVLKTLLLFFSIETPAAMLHTSTTSVLSAGHVREAREGRTGSESGRDEDNGTEG